MHGGAGRDCGPHKLFRLAFYVFGRQHTSQPHFQDYPAMDPRWMRFSSLRPLTRHYFTAKRVVCFCQAIPKKAGLDLWLWGFVDGNLLCNCRPVVQKILYWSKHKEVHGLKYKVVATSDGLIAHMSGPIEGKRHNSGVLQESWLLEQLQEHMYIPGEDGLYAFYSFYADSAFSLSGHP